MIQSSFINSLLEEPLLPHKNTGACTASITTIRNTPDSTKFRASIELLSAEQFKHSMEQYVELLNSIATLQNRYMQRKDSDDDKFPQEIQSLNNRAEDY